jgi:release factor glutamine methyltransferase
VNRRQALNRARSILAENNIDDSFLECEILLRYVLGIDRDRLFSDLDADISPSQVEELLQLVERRKRGEPSAYITGHREFFGLDFIINPHVLIPRPETELLVEKAIDLCRTRSISTIADIGTGCGAIAVSLAVNLPSVTVYATDVSPAALEVAAQNCARFGVKDRIILLQGDLLKPLPGPVDMIIANLPYVRKSDLTAGFEPELALNGGKDGLDKIKILCRQVGGKLLKNGSLLLEIGQGQADAVTAMLRQSFPSALIETDRDLAGIERMISLRLTS